MAAGWSLIWFLFSPDVLGNDDVEFLGRSQVSVGPEQ